MFLCTFSLCFVVILSAEFIILYWKQVFCTSSLKENYYCCIEFLLLIVLWVLAYMLCCWLWFSIEWHWGSIEYIISFVTQGNMSSVSSSSGILGPNLVYNYRNQIESGSSSQALSSISFPSFPERPDQPECRYFMNTGSCKYGADCKYHHPKERLAQIASNMGPFGLPLRPVSSGLKTFRSNNFYGLQFWACLGLTDPMPGAGYGNWITELSNWTCFHFRPLH